MPKLVSYGTGFLLPPLHTRVHVGTCTHLLMCVGGSEMSPSLYSLAPRGS